MKRFFKYLGVVLAGAFAISSCVQEELVTYDPDAGAVQTLGDIAGCTLNADGDPIETTFADVDFGISVPVVYNLNIAPSGEEISTKLTANIGDGKISIAQKDLNAALLNMGAVADVEFAIDFQLVATLADIKGSAITDDESYVKYSNVVTATFVPYSTTVLDVDKYEHIYIIGAAESVGAWSHGNVFQFLYNYNGDGKTYTGMIYYTDGAAGGWKLTGAANWDNGNWGSPDQAEAAEAAEITLIDDGGSKDIKCYSLPYYMWTFDKEALKLKKEFGFTTMGIVGSFNDWNVADESCVMTYNAYYHRFYIDYEFAADGELKFAADGAWNLDFGVNMEKGGPNIPVAAGKYRIYLDFNKNEYTFDANMYGKEEPGASPVAPGPEEPEPTPVVGWGLVGEYNNWGAEADVMLASDGTFLTAKGVAISGQVKFRKDGDWAVNFGAPGEVEPVEIAVNTELELVANGKNFSIAEGTYDVYLDEANAKAWFINDGSYPGGGAAPEASEWGIVGVVNGWAAPDITMYKTATEGLFVAYKVEMPDGGFKIRANGEWNDAANYGLAAAGPVEVDHAYDLICSGGSGDMTLVAGTYDIWFDLTNTKVYIMTPGKPISEAVGGEVTEPEQPEQPADQAWYLVGNFNGWATGDANYQFTKEGDWYVFKGFTADGQGVKLNAGSWDVNRGGTFVAANEAIAIVHDGADMYVAAGTYDVYMNADASELYFMEEGKSPIAPEPEQAWYLVGNFNGWATGDANYQFTKEGDWYVFKGFTADGQGVKFNAGSWDVNRGGAFVAANEAIAIVHDGADMYVAAGTYDVYMNAATDTAYFMEVGQTPAN